MFCFKRSSILRRGSPPRPTRRLHLEELEDRAAVSTLYGLGVGANANTLFRFDSATPGTVSPIAVTGLTTGDTLVGADFRPRTGQLIGLGVNGDNVRLYRIDALTGVATAIGAATVNTISGATAFGIDFNPTVDRLRVVNNLASDGAGGNANNFRLNPNDGSLVAVDPDLDFTGLPGGSANAPEVAVAYTNNFDNQGGATTLNGILSGGDRLVVNGGAAPGFPTLSLVGFVGVDVSNNAGFDIAGVNNTARAILDVGGVSGLYNINLTTGEATLVGNVGNGTVDFGSLTTVPDSFVGVGSETGMASRAILRDAQSGATVLDLNPYPGFIGGVRVAVGDLNRDGMPDLVTAAGPGGGPHVRAFDGRTGQPLFSFFAYDQFSGGVFVAVGDVNRDGFGDIITGADAGAGPHVKAFSGADGAQLLSFFAYDSGFTGGVRVATADFNNDGFDEIITGAGMGGGPHVRVFTAVASGTFTGVATQMAGPLGSFFAYGSGFIGGIYVAGGDVNGDGVVDIVTGAGPGAGPHVKAFNGSTGAELDSFFAYSASFSGGVRVGVSDFNADGRYDITTVPGSGTNLTVDVFDGPTQQAITAAAFIPFASSGGGFVSGARF